MKVSKISAITIFTKNMKNSCMFYSIILEYEPRNLNSFN